MKERGTLEVERLWRAMLELFPGPALITAQGGIIQAANSALEELVGLQSAELHERNLTSMVNDVPEMVFDYLHRCGSQSHLVSGRLSWRLASGETLRLRTNGFRLPAPPDANAEAPELISSGGSEAELDVLVLLSVQRELEDTKKVEILSESISELSKENVEHKSTEEHLQRALEDRDEFLSAAAHELRNPLNALQLTVYGLVRMIKSGEALQPDQLLARVNRIGKQIARLSRLVNTLLDVSRLTSGRVQFNFERFDLTALAAEAAERFTDGGARDRLIVEGPRPLFIVSDRLRLDQVITNLLSNAIKYGEGKPIEVNLREHGDHALIEVTDHGIGISEQDLGRIFERFERAAADRSSLGFGLGLWIARGITENLGGNIQAQSTLGLGTTFTIEIPKTRSPGQ
ncbi:MAG: sensor histidine kinase [Candidatus Binataceae bacterium]